MVADKRYEEYGRTWVAAPTGSCSSEGLAILHRDLGGFPE